MIQIMDIFGSIKQIYYDIQINKVKQKSTHVNRFQYSCVHVFMFFLYCACIVLLCIGTTTYYDDIKLPTIPSYAELLDEQLIVFIVLLMTIVIQ
jgi:hypothetical protein